MNRSILLGVIILAVMGITACQKPGGKEIVMPTEQEELPCLLVVNNKLYELFDAQEEPMGDSGAVSGYILSTVNRTMKPRKNGQSNFGTEGDPYCLSDVGDADEVVVSMTGKWMRFERTKFEAEDGLAYDYILSLNGTYPNGAKPTELTVLTNDPDLTFDMVVKKQLSSVYDPEDPVEFYLLGPPSEESADGKGGGTVSD